MCEEVRGGGGGYDVEDKLRTNLSNKFHATAMHENGEVQEVVMCLPLVAIACA